MPVAPSRRRPSGGGAHIARFGWAQRLQLERSPDAVRVEPELPLVATGREVVIDDEIRPARASAWHYQRASVCQARDDRGGVTVGADSDTLDDGSELVSVPD